MPWTSADAKKHNKGLSKDSASRWSSIANAVLSRTGDEGMAVRVANSRVKPSNKEAIKRRLMRNG